MIKAGLAQFPLSLDISRNTDQILAFLRQMGEGELLVLPEGAVSGYEPDMVFLAQLDQRQIDEALDRIAAEASARRAHVFLGTVGAVAGGWGNLGIYLGPKGERATYQKCNLATAERGHMIAGDQLPVFEIEVGGERVPVAMQLCREIRYPAQWEALARKGAKIFVYMTNAIGNANELPVWRAHLISRAAETQRYVLASNNAAVDQKCPTLAVGPTGHVLREASGSEALLTCVEIDPGQVSDWYLDQARSDIG